MIAMYRVINILPRVISVVSRNQSMELQLWVVSSNKGIMQLQITLQIIIRLIQDRIIIPMTLVGIIEILMGNQDINFLSKKYKQIFVQCKKF